jgi:hypothetical protein
VMENPLHDSSSMCSSYPTCYHASSVDWKTCIRKSTLISWLQPPCGLHTTSYALRSELRACPDSRPRLVIFAVLRKAGLRHMWGPTKWDTDRILAERMHLFLLVLVLLFLFFILLVLSSLIIHNMSKAIVTFFTLALLACAQQLALDPLCAPLSWPRGHAC